ncbi:ComF family protein [Alkalicoccobacillus gibsonii]|uniref:ComF family protein n=1 Tax=Alkalicoccobacillus gibsonii TaxID=79881 RepID=UPI003517FFBF
MNRCLKCLTTYFDKPSWSLLLMKKHPNPLCYECSKGVERIAGERCQLCSRSLEKISIRLQKNGTCYDCIRWTKGTETKDLLEGNHSILEYNPFLKEWFAQFKFKGDAVAASYFGNLLYKHYKSKYAEYTVVPIPLSQKSLENRTFNQVDLMIQNWRCRTLILGRSERDKQSKKSREERIALVGHSPFYVKEIAEKDLLKKVVLIDDIYTTGTTVRQAAKSLKEAGAETVASLTVAR